MARSFGFGLRLLCLLILVGLAGCQSGKGLPANERETRVLHVEHAAGAGLRVTTHNGAVAVYQDDRADVQITAELRAQTKERLAEAVVIAKRDDSGVLEVFVEWPGGKPLNNEACEFELLLPDAAKIEVKTSNGAVRVEHVGDEAVVRTSNGQIVVQDVRGPVYAHSSNGKIMVEDVTGPVDVDTSNGRVDVINTDGRIKARTANGAVHMTGVKDAFELRTNNGQIEIELADSFTGEVDLHTNNGRVSASGLNGVEVVDSGPKSMQLRFSGGDSKSTARTHNGKIQVSQAD